MRPNHTCLYRRADTIRLTTELLRDQIKKVTRELCDRQAELRVWLASDDGQDSVAQS